MTLSELLKDTRALQGLLKTDGLYTGRIDGIHGPKTAAALAAWQEATAALRKQYPLDTRSESNLETCTLTLQRAIRPWMAGRVLPWAKRQSLHAVRIICGFRSNAEQNAIGSAYTSAKGGTSYHNYGAAIDLGIFGKSDKDYLGNDDRPYIALQRECGTPTGCIWGGTWTKKDYPHYQLGAWGSTISPLLKHLGLR